MLFRRNGIPRAIHLYDRFSDTWGGDGGLRPCMDDSDGMGVQRGAGRSPVGSCCPPQAPKNLGKPLKMYENAPTFTHLEHIHSRFRRRSFTFHNRISCSSSHSFRNPLYEARFLSLSIFTQLTRAFTQCCKAMREDRMWHFSTPVIAHKPWYPA